MTDTTFIDPARKAKKKWAIFAIRLIVTISILTALFTWLKPAPVLTALQRTGVVLWVSTVAVVILLHVGVAAKWRLLLDAAGSKPSMVSVLRAHGAGLFANMYLPSLVGGDVVRAGMVAPGGKNLPVVVTGSVADRLTDCLSLIILAVAGLVLTPAAQTRIGFRILIVASVAMAMFVVASITVIQRVGLERLPAPLAKAVSKLRMPLETMLQRKTTTLLALVISISLQACFILQNVLLGRAIGVDAPVSAWFVAVPLAKLASMTPLSVGGLGVRESVFAALLSPFSVPATLAVAESLVWQTITYGLGLFGGITSLWIGQFRSHRSETNIAVAETETPTA